MNAFQDKSNGIFVLDPGVVRELVVVDACHLRMGEIPGTKQISDLLFAMDTVDFSVVDQDMPPSKARKAVGEQLLEAGIEDRELVQWMVKNVVSKCN